MDAVVEARLELASRDARWFWQLTLSDGEAVMPE
jgi:hypothetical protein